MRGVRTNRARMSVPEPAGLGVVSATGAAPAALEATAVVKRFGGTKALAGVDLIAVRGEITGLVGPNGSGKTTMLKCLSGFLQPDSGQIRLFGERVENATPQLLARRGLTQTFQRVALGEEMTVAENVAIADDGHRMPWPARLVQDTLGRDTGLFGVDAAAVLHALELTGLESYVDDLVAGLPLGIRRRVELARALAASPRLLLLDEPTSGLDVRESHEMADLIASVVNEGNLSVLIVEHDLAVIGALCSTLVVLEQGQVISRGPTADVLADERVRQAYLGSADV